MVRQGPRAGCVTSGLPIRPGQISKEHRAGEWPVWEAVLHKPKFASFAKRCGGRGACVTSAGDIAGAFAKSLQHDGPALVEVIKVAELV